MSEDKPAERQFNMRIPEETAASLEAIALIEGVSMKALTIEAVQALVDQRRADNKFTKRRDDYIDALKRL